jgi:hypothetical protein
LESRPLLVASVVASFRVLDGPAEGAAGEFASGVAGLVTVGLVTVGFVAGGSFSAGCVGIVLSLGIGTMVLVDAGGSFSAGCVGIVLSLGVAAGPGPLDPGASAVPVCAYARPMAPTTAAAAAVEMRNLVAFMDFLG